MYRVRDMGKAWIHKVLMYATEAVAISMVVLFLLVKDIVLLFFLQIFVTITCTFHILYLLSEVYEKLEGLGGAGHGDAGGC